MGTGDLPEGDVTFHSVDLQGSTALLSRVGPQHAAELFAQLHQITRATVALFGGAVYRTEGDGVLIAYDDAGRAMHAALALAGELETHPWGVEPTPRFRNVLHRGEAVVHDGEYASMGLHQLARLGHAAHGGQVVCSAEVLGEDGTDVPVVALGEYWVRDFPSPVRLFQLGKTADPDVPPVPLPRADLTNITTTARELVGRDELVVDIEHALSGSRLVTLIGPGGVGKTSVAVAVAGRAVGQGSAFWLVDLTTVDADEDGDAETDAANVVTALARALGMSSGDRGEALARLGSRPVTLLIDNCEQVVDAAASLVADILETCPQATVLATSREPLRLPDEHFIEVTALDESDAVALFESQARRVAPRFRASDATHPIVADLCRELDGLPLALELAARSVRHLSPQEILRRLRAVGALPAARTAGRHASLDSVVEWSLSTCTEQELTVFARMGVFAAPVPVEAIGAVCGLDEWTAGDVVASLVDRSLVTADIADDDTTRFSMLVTLRRAAHRRLGSGADADEAMRAHARWALAAADAIGDDPKSSRGADGARVAPEMLLALDRAGACGLPADEIAQLMAHRVLALDVRDSTMAARLIESLLDRPDLSPAGRAQVYSVAVYTPAIGDDAEALKPLFAAALSAAREGGDPAILAWILSACAVGDPGGRVRGSDPVSAVQWAMLEEAEALLPLMTRERMRIESSMRNAAGILHFREGDLVAAREEYVRSMEAAVAIGDTLNEAVGAYNIAEINEMTGDLAAAAEGYAAAAEAFYEGELHQHHAFSAQACALALEKAGELDRALDVQADAVLSARRTGLSALIAELLANAARMAQANGDLAVSLEYAHEVMSLDPDGPHASAAAQLLAG